MEKDILETTNDEAEQKRRDRVEELLRKTRYCENQTFTSLKMTDYYGEEYARALERVHNGETESYYLVGKMFEESVYHG